MVNVFSYLDYRSALREVLEDRDLTSSQLATAMRIQPSYLSRILQKQTHASADQLFLGCRALALSEEESEFLSLLLEWARSDVSARKDPLKKKIVAVQESKRGSEEVLAAEFQRPETSTDFSEYYLDPVISIIHACLSIPAFQTKPELIARAIGIAETKLKSALELLLRTGIIALDGKKNRYRVLKPSIHLDRKSVLNEAYQTLFRHYSIEHLRRVSGDEKFQFAVTITADDETRKTIHAEFNAFLKRIEALVQKAPSEQVFQLNFDLFRWDR